MASYESDVDIQDIHDQMYQREAERPTSGLSKLTDKTKFWLIGGGGVIVVMMYLERIQTKTGLVLLALVGVIAYVLSTTDPTRQMLTDIECRMRLMDHLRLLQQQPVGDIPAIPKGLIGVDLVGRLQHFEGRPQKRSYGIKLYDSERDITEMYIGEVDVYTGDMVGCKFAPEGVTGDETRDIKLIPGHDMLLTKKKEEYLGKAYRK